MYAHARTIPPGAWINAVIHSIMYSYYAFTVLKLGIAKLIKVSEGTALLPSYLYLVTAATTTTISRQAAVHTATTRHASSPHPPSMIYLL
jgi:hypothetical protein